MKNLIFILVLFIHLPLLAQQIQGTLVEKAEDYLYSSARNYVFENEGCLLEVDLLEPYLPGSSFVYLPGFGDQS